jgi:hypothetical protein
LRAVFAKRRAARAEAPPRATGTQPTYPLSRYAGTYADSAFGTIEVTLADGALRARYGGADLGALDHWEYDAFRSRPVRSFDQPMTLTFIPDGTGALASVRAFGVSFGRVRGRSQSE